MGKDKHIRFDWAIKRLLRNKANFAILEGFLSELLKKEISIQEILESESNQARQNAKYNRVDILVIDSSGNLMLVEVQNEKEDDYFHRMLFGQAKLITERLDCGDLYGKLTRIYSINIVYFPLGTGDDYVYVSNGHFTGMHNNDILQLSAKQQKLYKVTEVKEIFTQYYILKVNTFNDVAKDTLDEWIYFLKNSEIKDSFTAKGLQEAKAKLRVDDLPTAEKEEYDIYIKSERIRESEIRTAYTDGIFETEQKYEQQLSQSEAKAEQERQAKEHAEAKAEHILKNAVLSMNKNGMAASVIAASLSLSEEDVKRILGEKS